MKQFKTTKFYRMFAAFLSIIMLSCTPTSMVEAKEAFPLRTEYTSANELCEICWLSYNKGAYGPIIVVQGQLQNWFIKKDVYLITLCGTELLDGQSTGILEDLWGDYDVTGKKGGHAKLTLDLSTLRFEQAPSWF